MGINGVMQNANQCGNSDLKLVESVFGVSSAQVKAVKPVRYQDEDQSS